MVTQAFLCEHHTTGRLDLEEPLRKHGFSEGYPSRGVPQQGLQLEVSGRVATEQQGQEVSGAFDPGADSSSTGK